MDRRKEDRLLSSKVYEPVAVILCYSKQVVEEGFLIIRVVNIRTVQRHLTSSLEERDSFIRITYLHLLLEQLVEAISILGEERVRELILHRLKC